MKITQISTRCWPYAAGLEEFIYSLSKEFALQGNDVTIVASNSSGEFSIPQLRLGKFPINRKQSPFLSGIHQLNGNFRIQRLNAYARIGPFHVTDALWAYTKQESEVVHIHSIVDLPLWLSVTHRILASKLFVTIHDVWPTVANPFEAALWKPFSHVLTPNLLKKFQHIIVPSPVQLEYLNSIGFDLNKVSLVPLCFDKQVNSVAENSEINREAVRARYRIAEDDFLIISVGRLISVKRYDLVIFALSRIFCKKKILKIKYLVVGADEGELSYLQLLVEKLKMSEVVIFVGLKNHFETLCLMKVADLFVMPSDVEAFNVATVEAMYLSVPVVLSSGVGVGYLIQQNKNGLVFRRNDLGDLRKILSELLEDPSRLRRLGFEGKKTVEAYCSPIAVCKRYIDIYRKSI